MNPLKVPPFASIRILCARLIAFRRHIPESTYRHMSSLTNSGLGAVEAPSSFSAGKHGTSRKAGKLGIGVIGCGYWGPNLLRNFSENRDCRLAGVADLNQDRLNWAKARYPTIKTTTAIAELIEDPEIDAVAIATPVFTHFELAMR